MDGIVHSFLDIFAAFELFPVCAERPDGVPGERSAPLSARREEGFTAKGEKRGQKKRRGSEWVIPAAFRRRQETIERGFHKEDRRFRRGKLPFEG